jgi:hypothetical protein
MALGTLMYNALEVYTVGQNKGPPSAGLTVWTRFVAELATAMLAPESFHRAIEITRKRCEIDEFDRSKISDGRCVRKFGFYTYLSLS